jgi:SOS response associated peptidase (SRAP)
MPPRARDLLLAANRPVARPSHFDPQSLALRASRFLFFFLFICVMPAAGFYEWQVQPDGTKQPYFIQPAGDGEVFSIAALWDRSRICFPAPSSRCLRMSC